MTAGPLPWLFTALLAACMLPQHSCAAAQNATTVKCPSLPDTVPMVDSIAYTLPAINGSYYVGTVAIYICSIGSKLVDGNVYRSCSDDGTWSGREAVCEATAIDLMGCPDIPDPSHGNIDFNVDKTAPFDIGTTATYHCYYGYHPVGGSLVRVCESGGSDSDDFWNGTAPICQGTCKTLPEVSNGIVSYSTPATERNEYLADSVASYTCDEGFELFGTGMRMCQSNKTWSGVEPKCQAVCPPLEDIADGSLLYTSPPNNNGNYQQGTVAMHKCDPNYKLNGADKRTCGANGKWSGVAPTCELVFCPHIPDPLNGDIVFTIDTIAPFEIGTQAGYHCNEGFVLVGGDAVRNCVQNAVGDAMWNGLAPVCQPILCPELPLPENAQNISYSTDASSDSTFGYLTEVEISCEDGYEVTAGDEIRTCEMSGNGTAGEWSGEEPTCSAIVAKCPDIPNPLNGKIDFAEDNLAPFDLGTTATYICDLGYAVTEGSKMRVCVMDELGGEAGIWNGKAPTCDAVITCPELEVPVGGAITYSENVVEGRIGVGAKATYSCVREGYGLKGVAVRTCGPCGETDTGTIGKWNPEPAPTCERIQCPDIPDPKNGNIVFATDNTAPFDHGTTATYICDPGFMPSSSDNVRRCVGTSSSSMGMWTGSPISCIPKPEPERCLIQLRVIGFTSGINFAGSNDDHAIQIETNQQTKNVPLRGVNDKIPNFGHMWLINFADFGFTDKCVTLAEIRDKGVSIIQTGNDGWNIGSMITLVTDSHQNTQVLTLDIDTNSWIDGNDAPRHLQLQLTRINMN